MTWKDAIIKSLEDMDSHVGTQKEIYDNIIKKQYDVSDKGKTPLATVNSQLGNFIRKGDSRIKRTKNEDNNYCYYLTKYEDEVGKSLNEKEESKKKGKASKQENSSYKERDLHPLLCTYLKGEYIHSKTIYHEHSSKNKDDKQEWTHPDIVGVKFIEYKGDGDVCQRLFKATKPANVVDIYSYELKTKIENDHELKQYFFQAVSNSSWANYGYLVAFEIRDFLLTELERLSLSFGIGFILLKSAPYESKILFPSKRREVDFKTMEKICGYNRDFRAFFDHVALVLEAENRYVEASEGKLEEICRKELLKDEDEIVTYCKQKHIPTDE